MKKGLAFLLIWAVCAGVVSLPAEEAHAIDLKKIARAVWAGVTHACDVVDAINSLAVGDRFVKSDLPGEHETQGLMHEQTVQEEGSGATGVGLAMISDPCSDKKFQAEMVAAVGSDSIEELCGYLGVLAKGGELPE